MADATDDLLAPFFRLALFRDLSRDHLTSIASVSDRVLFQPGEALIEKDTASAGAILVIAGAARRVSSPGHETTDETITAGMLLAEMAMLVDTEHSSTIVAVTSVKALMIRPDALRAVMETTPAIAHHFERVITSRLGALADELRKVDASLASADHRSEQHTSAVRDHQPADLRKAS